MSTATKIKQDRINLRLNRSSKETLERAARFEGKNVSNFILTSALIHAEKTIHEHEIMNLNRQDSEVFFNALTKPISFNKKLAAALEEHDQRIVSQ